MPDKHIVRNRVPVLPDGTILQNGQRVWIKSEEYDMCDGIRDTDIQNYFEVIAHEFLATGKVTVSKVGNATSYLFDAAELVKFAVAWMENTWST